MRSEEPSGTAQNSGWRAVFCQHGLPLAVPPDGIRQGCCWLENEGAVIAVCFRRLDRGDDPDRTARKRRRQVHPISNREESPLRTHEFRGASYASSDVPARAPQLRSRAGIAFISHVPTLEAAAPYRLCVPRAEIVLATIWPQSADRLPGTPTKLPLSRDSSEADDEARTRDPQLGKLMLYQLSYVRNRLGC